MQFSVPPVDPPAHVPRDRIVDFDLYNLTPGLDVHSAWKSLQAPGIPDIVWTPRNGGHWIVTRGQWIRKAYMDYDSFGSRIILVPKAAGEQYKFIPNTVDPPVHGPYRALLHSGLSPKAVAGLDRKISALAESLIDGFRDTGACDVTRDYAGVLPIQIFLAMCDLPLEDGPMLKHWADQFTRPDGSMTIQEASAHFYSYLTAPLAARRQTPRDDFLSRIVNGEVDGRKVNEEEALALTSQVLLGGLDTVANFLSFALLFLARNPGHRQALIANPDMIPEAANELLRRFPLATSARVVNLDVSFAGADLKEGDMLVIPSILHGLDDLEYDEPLTVDFTRSVGNHSTFGGGPHHCPGAHLARAETRITLAAWLRKIPDFQVQPGAEIAYRGGVVSSIENLPLVWDVGSLPQIARTQ